MQLRDMTRSHHVATSSIIVAGHRRHAVATCNIVQPHGPHWSRLGSPLRRRPRYGDAVVWKEFHAGFGKVPKFNTVMNSTTMAEYIAALGAAERAFESEVHN